MVQFDSCAIYITSANTLKERIKNIHQVMKALQDQRLAIALNPNNTNFQEYSLDDGQTKIRTVYRSPSEITTAINALEIELHTCYNQLNGRVTRLVDSKNFKGGRTR